MGGLVVSQLGVLVVLLAFVGLMFTWGDVFSHERQWVPLLIYTAMLACYLFGLAIGMALS